MKRITKKAMRVTTTFTGAAACLAALTPTAMAATTKTAHEALPDKPNLGMHPAIKSSYGAACDAHPHWVHIYGLGAPSGIRCFGFAGTTSRLYQMSAECGGNNYGVVYGVGPNGSITSSNSFSPGTYARTSVHSQYAIAISRWSGYDSC